MDLGNIIVSLIVGGIIAVITFYLAVFLCIAFRALFVPIAGFAVILMIATDTHPSGIPLILIGCFGGGFFLFRRWKL